MLVGRRKELADLDRLLDAACAGSPSLTLVEGAAGIGKTSLVRQFVDAHADDVTVRWAGGAPWESTHPYGVAEQLLHTAVTATSPLDVARDLLDLCDGPVILVVDNAHRADAESLHALSSAVRRVVAQQLLVVLIVPDNLPDDISTAVFRFLSDHRAGRVHVEPLSPADITTLALRMVNVELPVRTARLLHEHTGGNPLRLTQLFEEVPPARWLEWQPTLPVPRTLATSIRITLQSCKPATRDLVEAAAILGADATFSRVVELAAVESPIEALDEAHAAGLVAVRENHGSTFVAFRDPMTKAAVEAELGPTRRQQLHQRAAEILDDEGRSLFHRVSATLVEDAELADDLEEFASRRAARGAWKTVAEALITASRLTPDKTTRQRRLIRGVDALTGAGDLPQALAFTPEIDSFDDDARRDAVLGYLAILRGRPGEAEQLLTHAWAECDPASDPDTAALICQRMVLHSLGRMRGAELVGWVNRAVALVGPDDPSAVESEAIKGLGLLAMGRAGEARAAYTDLSARVPLGAQSQRVGMGKGWLDLALDEPEAARRELENAVPTGYRRGSERISLWAQSWLARTQFALGEWDDAIATVHHAAAQLDTVGLELVRPLVHWTGAQTHALRGNWAAAREHLRRGAANTHDYEIMLVPSCLARAQCAEVEADYPNVIRHLQPLLALQPRAGIDEPGSWPWVDLYANALVMTGRVNEADMFLTPHERLAADRGHRSAMARLGYARGRIDGARGDIDTARETFETALHHLSTLPLPYDRARVNYAYGQTLRRAGKRRDADAVMRAARELYAALGAAAYVQRCDRELKAGGLNLKRTALDISDLTPQEQAVADLVAAGKSNKEAASELFLSVKTVQYHLTRVYAKLGLRSRSELAAHFRDQE